MEFRTFSRAEKCFLTSVRQKKLKNKSEAVKKGCHPVPAFRSFSAGRLDLLVRSDASRFF